MLVVENTVYPTKYKTKTTLMKGKKMILHTGLLVEIIDGEVIETPITEEIDG